MLMPSSSTPMSGCRLAKHSAADREALDWAIVMCVQSSGLTPARYVIALSTMAAC